MKMHAELTSEEIFHVVVKVFQGDVDEVLAYYQESDAIKDWEEYTEHSWNTFCLDPKSLHEDYKDSSIHAFPFKAARAARNITYIVIKEQDRVITGVEAFPRYHDAIQVWQAFTNATWRDYSLGDFEALPEKFCGSDIIKCTILKNLEQTP